MLRMLIFFQCLVTMTGLVSWKWECRILFHLVRVSRWKLKVHEFWKILLTFRNIGVFLMTLRRTHTVPEFLVVSSGSSRRKVLSRSQLLPLNSQTSRYLRLNYTCRITMIIIANSALSLSCNYIRNAAPASPVSLLY